jgi:hypothetical protein
MFLQNGAIVEDVENLMWALDVRVFMLEGLV